MANDSERNDDRENDQNNNNKKKNGILKPQGKKTDKIEKKMKEIKEQKPHFNEMTGSLNNLLTPVTSRTMTKNT
ncbi:GD16255 [Drosophila simulans]|uniref:GD16255 n=2 Tax=Drosophila simulans TaxID=7240 RepID=B4R4Z7_DROSI|nr:GD16255 [Drosophila simulans]